MAKKEIPDEPILDFETPRAWEAWLAKNFADSGGVWLRIHKKASETTSITYAEALDVALCYGWIDSQKRPGDAFSWLQRFGPRRAKSGWSRINTAHVERLIQAKKMKPPGLREVEAAKADGRWQQAYDSPGAAEIPADFLAALAKNKKAKAFFESLNKANTYAIAYRLQTAKKPETRERRLRTILEMMAKGEKYHP
ncbi:MAG TPA: YdeI/OmpD-associated family protein [Thermoanaerobaculia bacterium]|nr:YdeI/OmpD-associated family protein [Thermoanaerobaculia bacterium]